MNNHSVGSDMMPFRAGFTATDAKDAKEAN